MSPTAAASSITDTQQVSASIDPTTLADAKGNAVPGAAISGVPTWGVADPTIATPTPSADGLSCAFVAAGKTGSTQVNVNGQATNPDGTTTAFSAAGTLTVTPGDVAGVTLTFGAASQQGG